MLFEKAPSDVRDILPIPIKQLGLKLESHKSPADVYVIDRAEKPSEN